MKNIVLPFLFAAFLVVCFFVLMGGSLDTYRTGSWVDLDDHPTNYYDTTQHPDR